MALAIDHTLPVTSGGLTQAYRSRKRPPRLTCNSSCVSGCSLKLPVLLVSSVVVVVVAVDVKIIEPSGTEVLLLYKIYFCYFLFAD